MLTDILDNIRKGVVAKLLFLLIISLIIEIVLTCYIPVWKSMLFEPIKDRNTELFYHGLIIFGTGLVALGTVQGIKMYLSALFSLELRTATSKGLYYRWAQSDSPQMTGFIQPQTEATRISTEFMVSIVIEVVISLFIVIGLIISNLDNPVILWGALIYSIIISILTIIFNKPMTIRNVALQEAEGFYNEQLSLIAGQKSEYPLQHFTSIGVAYIRFQLINMFFTLTSSFTGILSHLVPYVLLAGVYFNGGIDFGGYMAGVATFELIVINATILTVKYPFIIKTLASWKIIKNFHQKHVKI